MSAEVKLVKSTHGRLQIYREPDPDRWYVMGVDIGMGLLKDWSVADVISRPMNPGEIPEQVAQFRSNLRIHDPEKMAPILYMLGKYYNWALIGIETAIGPGITTAPLLANPPQNEPNMKKAYPCLYYHVRQGKPDEEPTKELGWPARSGEKRRMFTHLLATTNSKGFVINSIATLKEMRGFSWDAEKQQYVQNYKDPVTRMKHDDCIISSAIGLQMVIFAEKEGFFRKPMTRVK